jgi:hypothetical protein
MTDIIIYNPGTTLYTSFTELTNQPGFVEKQGNMYIFDNTGATTIVPALNSCFTGKLELTQSTEYITRNNNYIFSIGVSFYVIMTTVSPASNPSEIQYICFLSKAPDYPVGVK